MPRVRHRAGWVRRQEKAAANMAFSGGMGADLTKKQEDMFDAKDAYVPSLRLAASR